MFRATGHWDGRGSKWMGPGMWTGLNQRVAFNTS